MALAFLDARVGCEDCVSILLLEGAFEVFVAVYALLLTYLVAIAQSFDVLGVLIDNVCKTDLSLNTCLSLKQGKHGFLLSL